MNEPNLRDWQTLYSRTDERLAHLLLTKLWSDCTFLVGSEAPEEIKAHKFVLAMCSPVFETMFYGSMPEGDGPIKVPDVHPEAFNTFLKFLYTDDTTLPSYQVASEVYCAAKKYMVPFIQEKCSRYMSWSLTVDKACFAYEFGKLFDEYSVLRAASQLITRRTKAVLSDPSFLDASINTVAEIFALKDLDITDEHDLFQSLERYAANMGLKSLKRNENPVDSSAVKRKRIKMENNNNDDTLDTGGMEQTTCQTDEEAQSTEILKEVRKAISHIRFLTLTPAQFGNETFSALITEDEAFAIMMNLAGVDTPLPEGICSSKEVRGLKPLDQRAPGNSEPGPSNQGLTQNLPPGEKIYLEAKSRFEVANFKTRKRPVKSSCFYTAEYQWQICVVPGSIRTDGVGHKVLGIYVECECPRAGRGPWACQASVSIAIQRRLHASSLHKAFTHTFTNNSKSMGFQNFIQWDTLCHKEGGYIQRNAIQLVVHVCANINTPTA